MFIDLKSTFNRVNRKKLWEIMEEKEVSKSLIERIKKIYEKIEATIRTKDGYTRSFTMEKRIRQMCAESIPV